MHHCVLTSDLQTSNSSSVLSRSSIATTTFIPSQANGRIEFTSRNGETNGIPYDQLVFLARNPFDLIALDYFHDVSSSATTTQIPTSYIETKVADYKAQTKYWLGIAVPKIFVKYEEFQVTPSHWGRVAFFLGVPVSGERLACTIEPSEDEVRRSITLSQRDEKRKKRKTWEV